MSLAIPIGFASVRMDFRRGTETDLKSIVYGVVVNGDTDDVATAAFNAWGEVASLRAQTPPTVVLVGITAYAGNDGPLLASQWSGPAAGTGANPDLTSPAVSFVAKKRTAFAGQRYRGRVMLPWAEEASVGPDGVITGARVGTMNTGLSNWLDFIAAEPDLGGMVILHEESLGPIAPTPVTSLTLRTTVGTVRRRQVIG